MPQRFLMVLALFSSCLFFVGCDKGTSAVALTANARVTPTVGSLDTIFTFDASDSIVPGGVSKASIRWDWDGDDVFETAFSEELIATHQYTRPGIYQAQIEIRDEDETRERATLTVTVQAGTLEVVVE